MRPKAEWAIVSETIRARGIILNNNEVVVQVGRSSRPGSTVVTNNKGQGLLDYAVIILSITLYQEHHALMLA